MPKSKWYKWINEKAPAMCGMKNKKIYTSALTLSVISLDNIVTKNSGDKLKKSTIYH